MGWVTVPPWIILGAVIVLVPIFVFWTLHNLNRQREDAIRLLAAKGAALIRSFEAGTRTGMMGMMGMHGNAFQLQRLLMETAQQPDIVYLIVTDVNGRILADNDPDKIGETHGTGLDLPHIARSDTVEWRQVTASNGTHIFEVFRRFAPNQILLGGPRGQIRRGFRQQELPTNPEIRPRQGEVIFVGLDMGPIDEAGREDTRHTIIMAFILLLIGCAGVVSLFLAQAYRSTRTSLTRIKAFSDKVVENMPVGLMAVDGEGRIASFNQAAESILKQEAPDVIGKRASEVLPAPLRGLTDLSKSPKPALPNEILCPLEKGDPIPLEVSVSSLAGEDGSSWGQVILFRDMTEVQDLKREIEKSHRLASLGRLAAGVAHEIRNPLSSIKGFATYFKERYRDNPDDQRTAEIMIREVDRLNRVIGQLLEFARPVAIEKKPTSLHTLIHHSLRMVERQAQEKGITIRKDLSPLVDRVSVDADRINQVLLNLYLNAIEAMEKGGALSVVLGRDSDQKRVKIIVSDTGVGIEEKDLQHIFDPYFTTRQSGTGLGLAIVHNIIESHMGEVRVQSQVGMGTSIIISLPDSAGS